MHKAAGSERRYTPEQVVWPNFVDFELINFSVTLTTHSPPLNFWALIVIKKWLKSVIFRLAVDLNAAYFIRKYAVFKRCVRWRHCDNGHVWGINGNLVFPRILSLPLNERSASKFTNQSKGFKMTVVTLSVLAADWLNVGEGNQLCSFLSVSLRWCKHEYQVKKTTTSTFKSKQCCKYSLRWWKQRTSSTDNRILYRRSNF